MVRRSRARKTRKTRKTRKSCWKGMRGRKIMRGRKRKTFRRKSSRRRSGGFYTGQSTKSKETERRACRRGFFGQDRSNSKACLIARKKGDTIRDDYFNRQAEEAAAMADV